MKANPAAIVHLRNTHTVRKEKAKKTDVKLFTCEAVEDALLRLRPSLDVLGLQIEGHGEAAHRHEGDRRNPSGLFHSMGMVS